MVLKECPFCHRLFEAELVSKEQVDHSELTKERDTFIQGGGARAGTSGASSQTITGLSAIGPAISIERIADNPEGFITYKLTYKCKHCGKEWSRLSVEEVAIPKEYVKDEAEKTEYDAEKEAEEAREEEYAREER